MLDPIATVDEAADLGYTVTEADLARASARIRAYTGQEVTVGESTVTLPGPGPWRLPQRPVLGVSVLVDNDSAATSFTLHGQMIYATGWNLTVTFTHGYDPVPDGIIEACCSIASRMGATTPQMGNLSGLVQTGQISAQFGGSGGVGSLTSGEMAMLDRLFPRLPRTSVLL